MNKYLLFFLVFSNLLLANVSLPAIFSDNMVLQRNSTVKIWGNANSGEEITLKTGWDSKEYKTKADNNSNWALDIATPKEGGPYKIVVKGYNELVLNNIMIGEVWLCSGQSNMEMTPAWGIADGDKEIQNATNPNIRFFNVTKTTADFPQNDVRAVWQESTPETMKNNSALAYFFAQNLNRKLGNMPIGLVISAWGGSAAEVWMPSEIFSENQKAAEEAKKIQPNQYAPYQPSLAFNSMINPLVGLKIRGFLWYQGESNTGSTSYENTFSALINSWRKLWKEDLPFYFVQIAPYNYGETYDGAARLRDAQRRTLSLTNTAMVVTSDISTVTDIHPKQKKEVGVRLANIALRNIYQFKNGVVNSPIFKNFSVKKNVVTVNFDNAEGLYFKNKTSDLFELAGDDKKFQKATAKVKGNKVIVTSENVKNPKYIRYAWRNNAQSDLFNSANLPASTFTTEY